MTVDYFAGLSALSRQHDLPFNIHILETKLQRVLGEEKYGKSLVRHVHDLGLLDERMMVIHAIWIDDDDIALLAASGCTVAHNPVCNLRLGSGVMPFRKLRDAGVPICLGSDEMNTDDSINLWFVAKTAALLHTLADARLPRRGRSRAEILRCADARRRARDAARRQLGPARSRAAHADLALLDLDTRVVHAAERPAPPARATAKTAARCASPSSPAAWSIEGRVASRRSTKRALRAEMRELMAAGRAAAELPRAKRRASSRTTARCCSRAAAQDVGMNRRLA